MWHVHRQCPGEAGHLTQRRVLVKVASTICDFVLPPGDLMELGSDSFLSLHTAVPRHSSLLAPAQVNAYSTLSNGSRIFKEVLEGILQV